MTERPLQDRVILHEDIGAMEADFSGMSFTTEAERRRVLRRGRSRGSRPPASDGTSSSSTPTASSPRKSGTASRRAARTPTSSTGSAPFASAPARACARRSASARSTRCSAPTSTIRATRRSSRWARCASGARRSPARRGERDRGHPAGRRHPSELRRRQGDHRRRLRGQPRRDLVDHRAQRRGQELDAERHQRVLPAVRGPHLFRGQGPHAPARA